jgi:hypothetical protein
MLGGLPQLQCLLIVVISIYPNAHRVKWAICRSNYCVPDDARVALPRRRPQKKLYQMYGPQAANAVGTMLLGCAAKGNGGRVFRPFIQQIQCRMGCIGGEKRHALTKQSLVGDHHGVVRSQTCRVQSPVLKHLFFINGLGGIQTRVGQPPDK